MASTLTVDNIVGATSSGNIHIPGHVVQVVLYRLTGSSTGNSHSRVDITSETAWSDLMSQTITTKFANSKILVKMHAVGYNSTVAIKVQGRILRDSTVIDGDGYAWWGSAASHMDLFVIDHLDVPNVAAGTTLTYKMQAKNYYAGHSSRMLYSDSGGSSNNAITLMEIAQ